MHLQPGIVFYDLEWSGAEIVQVGAVVALTGETFDRTIVPQRNIQSKVWFHKLTYIYSTNLSTNIRNCVCNVKLMVAGEREDSAVHAGDGGRVWGEGGV